LPDFPSQQFHTHGDTYEEALKNAQEVLELLVEEYQEDGKPLPEPKTLEQLTLSGEASRQAIA
jgi:predicted RNase H-like HicB family nuclease